jgi:hypothetical protein
MIDDEYIKKHIRPSEAFYFSDWWTEQYKAFIAGLPDTVEAIEIPASPIRMAQGEIFNGRKLARRMEFGDVCAVVEKV